MDTNSKSSLKEPVARILVVDDHPNTATTLARAIAQLGSAVDVYSATSGQEALAYADKGSFDVLITDMMMPGMNGLELIEKLRSHPAGRTTHNILITAYDVPGLKESARRLKVDETIIKPVRPEKICQIVSNVLENMGHTKRAAPIAQTFEPFKILVADDTPDNLILIARYMKSEGFRYVTAADGVETLQKIRAEMPDLILLDINMPKKDGLEVLKELRADPEIAHIPVIIFTAARLNPEDIQSGLNLGADDYITKPFERHELFARIRTKLRVKEAEDHLRRRNRELNVLPEIAKELSAHLDINDLLSIILHRAVDTLGAVVGHITIFNTTHIQHKTYRTKAASSIAENHFPTLDRFLENIDEARQPLIINDISKEARWQVIPNDPTRSVVIVPMFGINKLLGLLVLCHEYTNYFNPEHLVLLQAITSLATIAVENTQLNQGLTQEKQKLDAVLQNAAEAILMLDEKGHLRLLNPAGEKLFTDFTAKLKDQLQAGYGYDEFVQMVKDTLATRVARSGEVKWPDQRTFVAMVTPIETGGVVAILHDITHFKNMDKVKNEFIATASHDLKTPITTITGFSHMLSQAGPLNEQQQDFVHRIQYAANNMTELVQNMMELVSIDLNAAQKHKPVEVVGLVSSLMDEFQSQAQAKNQSLDFTIPDFTAVISGDALQLKQLFRNLISNAIKYTPQDGTVTLSCSVEMEMIRVHVKDTGFGIPAADLPFIFDRFYRVRNGKHSEVEGNGLGLAIVKSIVEQHAGQIGVQSEPGQGSCFTIALPLASTADSSIAVEHPFK